MEQIMKSLASMCPSVCHLYGCNSQSILMKLCTVVRNPKKLAKSKIEFVIGQNPNTPSPIPPPIFTPIMHFQWQGLDTTVVWPVNRLKRFIAQRTLLGGRYTDKVEKCYNFMFFNRKLKMELQHISNL